SRKPSGEWPTARATSAGGAALVGSVGSSVSSLRVEDGEQPALTLETALDMIQTGVLHFMVDSNLQQEGEPHQTQRPPRDSSIRGYPRPLGWCRLTRQAHVRGHDAALELTPIQAPTP